MRPERWDRVGKLYQAAREVPRKAQAALLRRASAGDRELDTLSLLVNIHEGEVVLHAGQKCNAMAGIAETFELDPKF